MTRAIKVDLWEWLTLPCIVVFRLLGVSGNALSIIKGSRQVQRKFARSGKRRLVFRRAVMGHLGLDILLVGHCALIACCLVLGEAMTVLPASCEREGRSG